MRYAEVCGMRCVAGAGFEEPVSRRVRKGSTFSPPCKRVPRSHVPQFHLVGQNTWFWCALRCGNFASTQVTLVENAITSFPARTSRNGPKISRTRVLGTSRRS